MLRRLLIFLACSLPVLVANGQVVTECPENIGFERGTFDNWECSSGSISRTGNNAPNAMRPPVITVSPSGPVNGIHTLIQGGVDPYGGFSLNAPNGSDYVVRLGNSTGGRGAERISYTLNVPANVDAYSVIFNYAVVFQNPGHDYDEQPKFTAQIIDLSSNTTTECGSFEFVAQGGLPGFEKSPVGDTVLYKPWSPVMVNLSNYLGRTIRLEFTTNDCSRGLHFGYAYIDFNENCSIPVIGNITCPEINSTTLKVLSGFSQYRWFDPLTEQTLGTGADLTLSPTPPEGTKIAVELRPYAGIGCTQTLTTTITRMSMTLIDPAPTCKPVDLTAISLKVGNGSDLTYTYWQNRAATIPVSDPKHVTSSGTYFVKGKSSSGCEMVLPTIVSIIPVNPIIVIPPQPVNYPTSVDITTAFTRENGLTYSYWKNKEATIRLNNPERIRLGGTFYIKGVNSEGCFTISPVSVDIIINGIIIPNTFTPNGDGINDVFTVLVNSKIGIRSFKIYNRWGDIVFETLDITNYWTGLRSNTAVPMGVYYWVLEAEEELKSYKRSGYVTVIR